MRIWQPRHQIAFSEWHQRSIAAAQVEQLPGLDVARTKSPDLSAPLNADLEML